jgi:hypothetical protein
MRVRGQSLAEYDIALAVIAVIALVGLALFGGQTSTILSTTSGSI